MPGFLAYIVPVDTGLTPSHPIAPGGPPPSIWPSPGVPTHPIYYPPGIWGGGNQPFPTPPIAPGGPPPSIWPSPGYPAHPIAPGGSPGYPAHPIYYPPGIWGPTDPRPTPPIALPPNPVDPPPGGPPTNPDNPDWEWVWSPGLGWHPGFVAGDKPKPPPG